MNRSLFHRRRNPVRGSAVLTLGALLWLAGPWIEAAAPPAVRGERGMVVSPEANATEIGRTVLQEGGTAVDAGVAVAFALAVTYPRAGNIGGGGFMLYRAGAGAYHALDFRERAPGAIRPESYLDEDGRAISERSVEGGLAVAVPGSVAGLARAHQDWGKLPWARLLAPAIRLAEEGVEVSAFLAQGFREEGERLSADPEARQLFTRDGDPLMEGDRLVQADLGKSLRRIAKSGPAGFYRGSTAEAVVETVRQAGGVMSMQDLKTYRVSVREPLQGSYRGHRIVSFPPPSSGGIVLLQVLGMLEGDDLRSSGFGASSTVHHMAEAERRAYADRSRWLGDPDHYGVPVDGLLDPAYLARRRASIAADRATPSRRLGPGTPGTEESSETLHYAVADSAGRVVAVTTTLNGPFGAAIVAAGTGVLLNNEMDDFALAPGVPNMYGLVGGEANAIGPGKRPLSSMTPTIVESPEGGARPALVLGSPGGSKIITAVLQVLVNVIDHGMPLQEAVNAPRFHHQWLPDRILYEPRAFPADVQTNLSARGHRLEVGSAPLGNVNAIGLDEDGAWLGAADPRRSGRAAGY